MSKGPGQAIPGPFYVYAIGLDLKEERVQELVSSLEYNKDFFAGEIQCPVGYS